jgi:chitinase
MSNLQIFPTPTGKRAIYYHTNWSCYARNFQVKDIPDGVMDIAYAFWNVNPDGSIVTGDAWADTDKRFTAGDGVSPSESDTGMFGNFGQFKKLRDSGRQMNVVLSLGGWTWSKNFSPAMSSETTRTNLVNNIVNTFKKYPIFSGVSLDWEYVSNDGVNYGNAGNIATAQDSANFVLFLQKLRSALDQNGMAQYTIAMCCVADPNKAKFDVEKMHQYLTELHVMTYDFHDGNWGETVAAHHTNPRKSSAGKFSCEEAADYYISRGVPSTKVFIGGAFYSRGFANTDGLGKSASGGSPDMSWEKGTVDYKALPIQGAQEYIDPESKGAYSYDPVKRILNTYDNKESIIEKCRIIYEKNLGGMLIWENSADKSFSDPRSLVSAIKSNLTHGSPSFTSTPVPIPTPVSKPSAPTPVTSLPKISLTIDSNGKLTSPSVASGSNVPKFKVSFTIDSNGTITGLKSVKM